MYNYCSNLLPLLRKRQLFICIKKNSLSRHDFRSNPNLFSITSQRFFFFIAILSSYSYLSPFFFFLSLIFLFTDYILSSLFLFSVISCPFFSTEMRCFISIIKNCYNHHFNTTRRDAKLHRNTNAFL